MRFVVYGAGAIGGVLGGRLHEAGHEVVLIARGPHLAAIQADGLRIESRLGEVTVHADAVGDPREIDFRADDVVFLCMKGQHTEDAVRALAATAPAERSVSCRCRTASPTSRLRCAGSRTSTACA